MQLPSCTNPYASPHLTALRTAAHSQVRPSMSEPIAHWHPCLSIHEALAVVSTAPARHTPVTLLKVKLQQHTQQDGSMVLLVSQGTAQACSEHRQVAAVGSQPPVDNTDVCRVLSLHVGQHARQTAHRQGGGPSLQGTAPKQAARPPVPCTWTQSTPQLHPHAALADTKLQ